MTRKSAQKNGLISSESEEENISSVQVTEIWRIESNAIKDLGNSAALIGPFLSSAKRTVPGGETETRGAAPYKEAVLTFPKRRN